MSIIHKQQINWASSSVAAVLGNMSLTGDAEDNRNLTIANAVTDQQVIIDFKRTSATVLFYLVADVVLTVKTNSTSAPDNTWTTIANTPIVWYNGIGHAVTVFIAADVTKLYITNASGGSATVSIRLLKDSTP
jgi:hypothetical protein